jgi:hypothetical protein
LSRMSKVKQEKSAARNRRGNEESFSTDCLVENSPLYGEATNYLWLPDVAVRDRKSIMRLPQFRRRQSLSRNLRSSG